MINKNGYLSLSHPYIYRIKLSWLWFIIIFNMLLLNCWGSTGGAVVKNLSTCQYRKCMRHGFDPWVGKIPWVGNGSPLQYSCLENLMDRRACQAIIREVAKESDTPEWLSTIANILFGTFACLFTGDTGLGLYFLLLYLSIFNIRVILTS